MMKICEKVSPPQSISKGYRYKSFGDAVFRVRFDRPGLERQLNAVAASASERYRLLAKAKTVSPMQGATARAKNAAL